MGKDDEDRDAILRRRNRFVAIALGGLAAGAMGCSDPEPEPVPCLDAPIEDAGGLPDAGEDAGNDAGPTPCLEPPLDAATASDAGPTPCLEIAADAGEGDSGT